MRYTEEIASKLYSYFIEHLDLKENSKGWLIGDCPHCHKKKKFGINVSSNLTNCFVCGTKTSTVNLVKQLEGFTSFHEVYKLLSKYNPFSIALSDNIRDRNSNYKDSKKIIKTLPEEYKMVGLYDSKMEKLVRRQLKKRGFSLSQAMLLGFGYCAKGEYSARLIIPFYKGGEVIYFNARSLIDSGPKYKNPDEESFGIGKGHIIYNHDAMNFYNKIWLFEGVLNAATIGVSATATGGKILSPWQLNEYIKAPFTKLIISLDDDAYDEALQIALQIAPFKKVKILKFPKGKDANNIGKRATKELEKNTPYMTYKEVYNEYIKRKWVK